MPATLPGNSGFRNRGSSVFCWLTTGALCAIAKDPVCGMTVDEKTALSAVRDGVTSYFCSAGRPALTECIPVLLLNPMLAAAAMSLSSLSVVINALRLRSMKMNS